MEGENTGSLAEGNALESSAAQKHLQETTAGPHMTKAHTQLSPEQAPERGVLMVGRTAPISPFTQSWPWPRRCCCGLQYEES